MRFYENFEFSVIFCMFFQKFQKTTFNEKSSSPCKKLKNVLKVFFDAESKNDIYFTPSDQILAAGGAENWPKIGQKCPFLRFRCTLQPKIGQTNQNEYDFWIQHPKNIQKMILV